MKRLLSCLSASLITSIAHADLVWSAGATPGPSGWTLQTAPSSLSFTASGASEGVVGSAFAAASLSDGYLKASVSSTATPSYVGTAISRVGLSSVIDLVGPQDVAGVVAITMTFDALWGGAGANQSWVQVQSGPGGDFIGFASGDPALRGWFSFSDNALYGQALNACTNCSYTFLGDVLLMSVTAYLPFEAGAQSVQYAAQIEISSQGSFIDGSHTARFSIDVPDGFAYSSALDFNGPALVSPVPEPGSFALMALGLVGLSIGQRARTRRQRLLQSSTSRL